MVAIATNAVEIGDGDYVVIDGYEPSPPVPRSAEAFRN